MNAGTYPGYRRHFNSLYGHLSSYSSRRAAYLYDCFGGAHFLQPVLEGEEWASFTIGNDPILQRMWASENGARKGKSGHDILLGQIESHETDVFYNLDPVSFDSSFVRKLPGCVKYKLCWRAAPARSADFGAYDRVMCNFPRILAKWEENGWKTCPFFPAHDPGLDAFASNKNRAIDVCFVGGFSRHHHRRTNTLDAVARLSDDLDIRYYFDTSIVTKLAEHRLGGFLPLRKIRRSKAIRSVCREPVFGRDYYEILGNTKIVLNGAIDMAGTERGNMRCFEAMGAGALLLSDSGSYPEGMVNTRTMLTYASAEDAVCKITEALTNWDETSIIAARGHEMIKETYSKGSQWRAFQSVIEAI